ncbi:MAG: hypothetical protein HOV78_05115 [Hamadaea sp.]|nr:hypothetical protein [Hamadaea sp.]
MNDLPAIIGAIGLLIGTVFGGIAALDRRRARISTEVAEELENYQRWRPRVRRGWAELMAIISELGGRVPPEVEELIHFPPPAPNPRHSREEENRADAS